MRLFIAIDLDDSGYFKQIQNQLDTENAQLTLTKTYHLTLKFLGEVENSKLSQIKSALQNIKFDSFKVRTTKIGVFPNQNFVRVVWIGLEQKDNIIELKNRVDDVLQGIFSKEKEFAAHITLARVKFVKDKIKFLDNLKKIKFESKEFDVKNIKLIKSTLTPEGPIYEDILKL